jgi:hypothetical protein
MKYIITENIFKRLIDKLKGGMDKEESEKRIKKLMDKFMTHHLFNGLKEGDVQGYVRAWYIGSHPVIGLTHNNKINFNEDLVDDMTKTFGISDRESKYIMTNWVTDKYKLGNISI